MQSQKGESHAGSHEGCRFEDGWQNETSSSPQKFPKTKDFNKISSKRKQAQFKCLFEEELDMDN